MIYALSSQELICWIEHEQGRYESVPNQYFKEVTLLKAVLLVAQGIELSGDTDALRKVQEQAALLDKHLSAIRGSRRYRPDSHCPVGL